MKVLFILIASILLLSTTYAETEDSVYVILAGDTVQIWNTGVYENCGCLFRMDVIISNDTIYVTEVNTSSDWAFCICAFDLCASVTGLQTGTYFVNVFRYMPLFDPDSVFYIGSASFSYVGSMLGFSLQSFQSDCYNITETSKGKDQPKEFTLKQNYPNPFNPTTNINYQIPELSFVTLKVFDVLGNEITTLVNEEKPAGKYEIYFNSHSGEVRNLPNGVYFYRLQVYPANGGADSFTETRKMILLK
jgi:hypothetical protein